MYNPDLISMRCYLWPVSEANFLPLLPQFNESNSEPSSSTTVHSCDHPPQLFTKPTLLPKDTYLLNYSVQFLFMNQLIYIIGLTMQNVRSLASKLGIWQLFAIWTRRLENCQYLNDMVGYHYLSYLEIIIINSFQNCFFGTK